MEQLSLLSQKGQTKKFGQSCSMFVVYQKGDIGVALYMLFELVALPRFVFGRGREAIFENLKPRVS